MEELTYSDPPHPLTTGPRVQVRSPLLVRPSHADNATKPAVQKPKIVAQVEPKSGSDDNTTYVVSTEHRRESLLSDVPIQRVWYVTQEKKPAAVDDEMRRRWDESKAAEGGWKERNAFVLQNLAPVREEAARRREEVARYRNEGAGGTEAAQTSWLSRIFPCLFPAE